MRRWEWLIQLIKFHGYTSGAEIGVHRGRTTQNLLRFCPSLQTLYAVDYWPDIPGVKKMGQRGCEQRNPATARRAFMQATVGYNNRLILLDGESVKMADRVEDGSLDFVFIDADHRYEHALADIKAWTPKVKEDGVITGHDYDHPRFPGVTKAVIECFGDEHSPANVDHVWYARKDAFLL